MDMDMDMVEDLSRTGFLPNELVKGDKIIYFVFQIGKAKLKTPEKKLIMLKRSWTYSANKNRIIYVLLQ